MKKFEIFYTGTQRHYNPYIEAWELMDWSIVRYGQHVYIVRKDDQEDLEFLAGLETDDEWLCTYRYWKNLKMDKIELCKQIVDGGRHYSEEFYSGENRLMYDKSLGYIY